MAEKIKGTDTLRQAYPKLNDAIEQSNEAIGTANTAKSTADEAKESADRTRTEFNTITNNDTSALGGQLSVGSDLTVYPDAQSRFIAEHNKVTADLAQMKTHTGGFVNVMSFGAKGNGEADDSEAIQSAIDSLNSGIVFFPPKKFIASGIIPKNNVTLLGYGTTISLPPSASTPIIMYNSDIELINFNMLGITFKAYSSNDKDIDLIHITQPNYGAPTKTWYMSSISDCEFIYGKRGIYCPVPGSIKINKSFFRYNDIGLEWEQEHFYITDSVFWGCRRGIQSSKGNHFSCINGVFAHCDEYGVYWGGFESAFIGCSLIDNRLGGIYGDFSQARIEGCRIIQCSMGVSTGGNYNIITGNQIDNGNLARDITDDTSIVGIKIDGFYNIVSNNTVGKFYRGIEHNGQENTITGNDLAQLTESAITVDNNIVMVTNNKIHACDVGINASKTRIYDAVIKGNYISKSKKDGIKIQDGTGLSIEGNYFLNNGTSLDNMYSGIKISGHLQSTLIANNVFRNDSTGKMMSGIDIAQHTHEETIVSGNVARSMTSGYGYYLPNTVTEVNNIGDILDITE